MPQHLRSRLASSWLVLLCVAVGLLAPTSASAVSCDDQVNDTPGKLVPCITQSDLWDHMQAFEKIAVDNPSPADSHPSRNSGEPGYLASAEPCRRSR